MSMLAVRVLHYIIATKNLQIKRNVPVMMPNLLWLLVHGF